MANIIKVSKEDRDIVQRANVESSSLANLISFMITNQVDINNERFLEYEKRYQEAYQNFEKEKFNIERKYLSNVTYSSWVLDYDSCEITYNV